MFVTGYSVIMGILWFTVALLIGSYLIARGKKVRSELVLLIFFLGIIRLIVPVEFWETKEIHDWNIYPIFQSIWNTKVIGKVAVSTICFWIWGVGSVLLLGDFCYKIFLMKRIINQSRVVSDGDKLHEICREAALQLNYKGKFKLVVTDGFSTAISAGVFSPVILIPNDMQNFTDGELIGILRHELMHYLRKDLLLQWGMNFIQCLFWWNPITYLVKSAIEQLIELRCDSMVCKNMDDESKLIYLQGIMHVLKTSGKEPELGIGYAKKSTGKFLQRRFNEVLGKVEKHSKALTVLLGLLCVGVFIFSYSFIIGPASMPKDMESQGLREGNENEDIGDFLLKLSDGTYWYFKDMYQEAILTEEEIQKEEYKNLPIFDAMEGVE